MLTTTRCVKSANKEPFPHCFVVYTFSRGILAVESGNIQRGKCLQRHRKGLINFGKVTKQLEMSEACSPRCLFPLSTFKIALENVYTTRRSINFAYMEPFIARKTIVIFKLICNFSLVNQTGKNNILENEVQLRNEPQMRNGFQLRNG